MSYLFYLTRSYEFIVPRVGSLSIPYLTFFHFFVFYSFYCGHNSFYCSCFIIFLMILLK
uniref:Uncharacterized protein n=1 Tax=Siphoviridae sp. ct2QJ10 TaxID=2825315 RepID=A0A8S5P9E4_9CAUD|nr:MAG TPA: hypothetical protein [Siphoviridae sp. ct2QJ10]